MIYTNGKLFHVKAAFITASLFLLLSVFPGVAQDAEISIDTSESIKKWKSVASAPVKRVEAASAEANGKLFVLGGFTMYHNAINRVDVYDPERDAWTTRSDMPADLTHANAVTDGERIWLAGGFKGDHPGSATAEVWEYDISRDSWSEGVSLPEPRAGGGLAFLDGKLHYFGGFKSDRDTTVGTHWVLPVRNGKQWEPAPDLPEPRGHLGVAVVKGKIYAIGGQYKHDSGPVNLSACHVFDPGENRWSSIADLPSRRNHFEPGTIVHNEQIIIVGGLRKTESMSERRAVNTITRYNPETDQWQHFEKLPEKLIGPAASVFHETLFVSGGGLKETGNPQSDSYMITLED